MEELRRKNEILSRHESELSERVRVATWQHAHAVRAVQGDRAGPRARAAARGDRARRPPSSPAAPSPRVRAPEDEPEFRLRAALGIERPAGRDRRRTCSTADGRSAQSARPDAGAPRVDGRPRPRGAGSDRQRRRGRAGRAAGRRAPRARRAGRCSASRRLHRRTTRTSSRCSPPRPRSRSELAAVRADARASTASSPSSWRWSRTRSARRSPRSRAQSSCCPTSATSRTSSSRRKLLAIAPRQLASGCCT